MSIRARTRRWCEHDPAVILATVNNCIAGALEVRCYVSGEALFCTNQLLFRSAIQQQLQAASLHGLLLLRLARRHPRACAPHCEATLYAICAGRCKYWQIR